MSDMKEKGEVISLLDLVLVIIKNWKFILIFSSIPVLLILLVNIISIILPPDSDFNLLPNQFKPYSTILYELPGSNGTDLSSMLSSGKLGSLSNLMGADSIAKSTIGELVKKLIQNNSIRDKVIEKYDFVKKYRIKKYFNTSARKIFSKRIEVEIDEDSSTITISYLDFDPVFASNVVNTLVEEIAYFIKGLSFDKTNTKKDFLENRIQIQEKEYRKVQDKFILFQKQWGIINVTAQTDATIQFVAKIQAQIMSKELELKNLEEYSLNNDGKVKLLKNEIVQLKELTEELKSGFKEYSGDFIPQNNIPAIAAEYLDIKQDLTTQGAILQLLKEQYEAVKIQETDNSQTFVVIDKAEVPEVKDSPKRATILLITGVVSFLLSIFLMIGKEFVNRMKKDPIDGLKLSAIKESFKLKIKK